MQDLQSQRSIIYLLIALLLGLLLSYSLLKIQSQQDNHTKQNVLIMGSDSLIPRKLSSFRSRTDFMMLASIDPVLESISLVSIPRDTKIKMHKEFHKINAANAIGGYKLARRAVRKLLDTEVEHVIIFSIAGAKELLEEFGEFNIFIKEPMSYHDYSADLHIEFDAGLQKLSAADLLNFLRYRSDSKADIGRIERQQDFIKSLIKKLSEPAMILKTPTMLRKISSGKYISSNMEFSEILNYAFMFRATKRWQVRSHTIPGQISKDGYGYWIADLPSITNY